MPSQNARKRKSDQMDDGPTTPTESPVKKMKMTQQQKQALIDNLQLEITERARQLRAQYALQCQDLKSRIERRINRVPIAMRKMKMGELMAQHQKIEEQKNPPPAQSIPRSPSKPQLDERPLPALPASPSKLPSPVRQPIVSPQKSRKRKSSAILIPSDKENHEPDTSNTALEPLPVQKNTKRARTAAATTATAPKRTTSRTQKKPLKAKDNPAGVLSPRSHNSRTLPRSPIKEKELPDPTIPPTDRAPLQAPPSPPRQPQPQPLHLSQSPTRPLSPSKLSPFKAATSAISAFAKRGYAAAGAAGARLTRPISREKDQPHLIGTGSMILNSNSNTAENPTSPAGRMLPPPRPALATLTGSSMSTSSIPQLSPQRTTSQASLRSNASEQSSTSTNGTTIVTKPTRGFGSKKATAPKALTAKKTTATIAAASKTKNKVVVSSSTVTSTVSAAGTVGALSPKAANTGLKRAATTAVTTGKRGAASAAAKKAAAAAVAPPPPTGRVLRKRN